VKQVSPGSYNGGEARVCVLEANTGEETVVRPWGYLLHLCPRRASINSLMVMLMPPHFVNGLFNVFRPDIGCIQGKEMS
jgi:hypothetical protein